jgi:aminotransferase in exopolysaccharide biosynthesis
MSADFIALSIPNLAGNELKYLTEALSTQWVSTGGPHIARFEQEISSYLSVKATAACQSGTAGLHLALLALNIERDSEVIVPTLTFIAAVNPVKYIGAHPIFMDCDDSLCMDMEKLSQFLEKECIFDGNTVRNKLTGRRIKAILVVHVFGNMADMQKLLELAQKYRLYVIEDATEALGTHYKAGPLSGKFAGTMSDIGVYSFNGNKIITTGGGGMVVSNRESLIDRVKFLSTQAKNDALYFIHDEIGYNYRMTNVQAAIGLGQLEQLETFIKTKTKNYNFYQKLGIDLLPFESSIRPNYWFYTHLTKNRDETINHLTQNGVQARPMWQLIHSQKCYKGSQSYFIERAPLFWEKAVNLPCSTNLDEASIQKIARILVSV